MANSEIKKSWCIKFQGKLPGAESMNLDAEFLKQARNPVFTPLLRFYDWCKPTLTIGYGQPRSDIDFEAMKKDGLDFAVRPTGGRAVLHWDEVTYSIILPAGHWIAQLSIVESYKIISRGLANGLRRVGIEAEVVPGETGGHKNPSCFSSTSRYEVVVAGKKLIGSAQRRKHGALLQQGSIPLGPEFKKLGNYLVNSDIGPELAEKATCVREISAKEHSKSELYSYLAAGLSEELGFQYERK